jgi:hypothetical protein
LCGFEKIFGLMMNEVEVVAAVPSKIQKQIHILKI